MRESLADIAWRICADADKTSKPLPYYVTYDLLLSDAPDDATVLELGVHTGESLKVWASYFSRGTVIGVDIVDRRVDFTDYPNIVFELGNQTDADRLKEICLAHAPDGLDIIVDDASHLGQSSLASYTALFGYLKPGGLYIVEDWGTGYFDEWPDGGRLNKVRSETVDGQITGRIPSHDFGMVGFVKSLVDELAGDKLKLTDVSTRPDIVSFIHFHKNIVIVKKA